MGGEDLTSAMQPAPCGCELAKDAERERDPTARKAILEQADEYQQKWGCPCAGYTPGEMDSACVEVTQAVGRLTGFEGAQTCPLYYVRLEAVHRAARARRWWDKGQLSMVEGKHPPTALVQAIDEIGSAYDARCAAENERLRSKHAKTDDE